MDRARQTFFMEYAPDQFEYVPNESFDQMLPVEDLSRAGRTKEKAVPAVRKIGWQFCHLKEIGKQVLNLARSRNCEVRWQLCHLRKPEGTCQN